MNKLDGKVAIITGAAGGIGSQTARTLADAGARVVLSDLPGVGVQALADSISKDGHEAVAYEGDVTDEAVAYNLMRVTRDAFGRLDVLDNNAGVTTLGSRDTVVTEMDVEIWDYVLAVNLRGPMLMCKHAIPLMLKNGGGSIINISSGMSLFGDDAYTAYSASKAALNALTRSIATAYGKCGIRCNAIAPGVILHGASVSGGLPKRKEVMESNAMTPRLGEPKDIAAMVAFLASEEAGFLTGQVISIDGGHSAHQPHVAQFRALANA